MHLRTYFSIFCLAGLYSCQSNTQNKQQGATENTRSQAEKTLSAEQEQKYCFLRTDGTQQQDSSYIQLTIRKESVSGVYNVIPAEKDARRGTVLGKADDHVLDLVWTFTQEGMQDTLRVVFAQQDGKLLRKPFAVDTLTGRQVTLDSSSFSEAYEPVDCASTSEGDYVDSP